MYNKETVKIVGVMSGTSLDGLDIALCNFKYSSGKYLYEILAAETIHYEEFWIEKLSNAHLLNTREFVMLNNEFGRYVGKSVREFLNKYNQNAEWIASHGHTVLHEPQNLFTMQIGNGASIVAESGINCINDFRNLDVCLGGQGAPLVPFGDFHLFNEYDACLNMGGFSNITVLNQNKPIAFDVCPVNILLNYYVRKIDLRFDNFGKIAQSGTLNIKLFERLNQIEEFQLFPRKSMSREWVEKVIYIEIEKHDLEIQDILRTVVEFVSFQIKKVIDFYQIKRILLTGGGVHNTFLTNTIIQNSNIECIIPNRFIVDFKEALIFAFLGFMKINNQKNVFSSITGASRDTSSGVIWV